MREKIFSLLIQENTPTPDKPQEIKSLLVNEEAMKYIEQQKEELERLHSIIKEAREFCKNDDNFVLADLYSQPIADRIQEELLGILDKVEEK